MLGHDLQGRISFCEAHTFAESVELASPSDPKREDIRQGTAGHDTARFYLNQVTARPVARPSHVVRHKGNTLAFQPGDCS